MASPLLQHVQSFWGGDEWKAWEGLLTHSATCTDPQCECKTFIEKFAHFSNELPIDPSAPREEQESWLWWSHVGKSALEWQCMLCGRISIHDGRRRLKEDRIKLNNLKRHAMTPSHQQRVSEFLGEPIDRRIPPAAHLKEVHDIFRSGKAPSAGYTLSDGTILCFRKLVEYLWIIEEAELDELRESIRDADCANILRDERLSRLHMRIRLGTEKSDVASTFLGQARHAGQTSRQVLAATAEVFRRVCTVFADAPKTASVSPEFLESLFDHLREIVEAVTVDSASNEVCSFNDMSIQSDDWPKGLSLRPQP